MDDNFSGESYINEIIRINYKCNWKCKFCNVLMTNNYGEHDISDKSVIHQILNLSRKYTTVEKKGLILSFSGGEPTLNKNLIHFIKLAKTIGIGTIQIQTNGAYLFMNKEYVNKLIEAGLNEIFLAQHSSDQEINRELGVYYKISDFIDWVKYIKKQELYKTIKISLNIVVNKINLYNIKDFLLFLKENGFLQLLPSENNNGYENIKLISFGLVQPNGYAYKNKEAVLLKYTNEEVDEIEHIVQLCRVNKIYPDFHFTAPPLCILDYPDYNLEHQTLKQVELDKKDGKINQSNLQSYQYLWKEKKKIKACNGCKNNNHCLGFYKNWLEFVGEDNLESRVKNYKNNYTNDEY